jgi:hypothetical protein
MKLKLLEKVIHQIKSKKFCKKSENKKDEYENDILSLTDDFMRFLFSQSDPRIY